MTIYKITQTETFFGQADSLDEAQELFNEGVYDCATSLTVDIIEADFENPISQLENAPKKIEVCLACGHDKNEGGYHRNDEVTITFSTLKKAQNEAIVQGIRYAMDYLEDINCHDGANAVAQFLTILTEPSFGDISPWEQHFLNSHPLFSTECEGSN